MQSFNTSTGLGSSFRTDIQGLRGIAIVLVVAFHLNAPFITGGFVGVDVFFALSGYLITALLVQEYERDGRINLSHFYARRVRRLLPASMLVTLCTIVAGLLLYSPFEQTSFSSTALAAATYTSNWQLLRDSLDYFAAEANENPFVHMWSLAIEEQFYLVWPLLLIVILRVSCSRRWLAGILAIITLVSFAAAAWFSIRVRPIAFYATPLRAWELALGGLACLVPPSVLMARPLATRIIGMVGILCIVGGAVIYSRTTPFPGVTALLPVVGTAALLITGASAPVSNVQNLLSLPLLQYFGRVSYSWYLWHWPILIMTQAHFPDMRIPGRILCVLIALALASLTYRFVESPIRISRFLVPRPAFSLALGGLGTAISIGAALVFGLVWHLRPDSAQQARYIAARTDNPGFVRDGCSPALTENRVIVCEFGLKTSPTTILLFGDSHAAHWFPALQRIADQRRWRLVTVIKTSCMLADVTTVHHRLGREFTECAMWRNSALQQIIGIKPDLVIASNSVRLSKGIRADGKRISLEDWIEGYRKTFMPLNTANIPTLLVRDVPAMRLNVPLCLSQASFHSEDPTQACATKREDVLNETLFQTQVEAIKGLEAVSILDMTDSMCDSAFCYPIRDGMVIFRDAGHLTATFSRSLAPVLESHMMSKLAAHDIR